MHYLDRLATAAVVLLPVLALLVKGGANGCLYLLTLVSLISIMFRRRWADVNFGQFLKQFWPLHLSMAGITLAIFLHQFSSGSLNIKTYDIPSRLAYFALIAWVAMLLPLRYLKAVQWGIPVGAIAAAIKAHIIMTAAPLGDHVGFLNKIPFGGLSLLLGVFSILSIGWDQRRNKWAVALKILGGCAGIYSSYVCLTRGAWLALPVLAAIAVALIRRFHVRHKLAVLGVVLVSLGTIYGLSSTVQSRIQLAADDIAQFRSGENLDTSLGIRFQHWRGSWELFKEHPYFGVGRENFYPDALSELRQRNIISEMASRFVHPHSEFFFNMATLGIFGVLAYLALHLVPACFFYKAAMEEDHELRIAGGMGLALVLGYFVFGLTEVIFFTTAACSFFSIMAAVFFACVVKRRQTIAGHSI